jgi:hypothetical protein
MANLNSGSWIRIFNIYNEVRTSTVFDLEETIVKSPFYVELFVFEDFNIHHLF